MLASAGVSAVARSVASEASELAGVARNRGLSDLADQLQQIEALAKRAAPQLGDAVGALARRLESYPPPGPQAIALPPLLNVDVPSPNQAPPRVAPPLAGTLVMAPGAKRPAAQPAKAPEIRALPDGAAPRPPPQLLVRSIFGFRAFGDGRSGSSAPPKARPPDGSDKGGLLVLGSRKARSEQRVAPAASIASPGSNLPAVRKRDSFRREPPEKRPRHAVGSRDTARWAYLVGGGIAAIAVVIVAVVVLTGLRSQEPTPRRGTMDAAPPPIVEFDAGAAARLPSIDRLSAMVHQHGQETPEIRSLIDAESRVIASCSEDPTRCTRGWARRSREVLDFADAGTLAPASTGSGPLAMWLQHLRLPKDFPLQDDPSLRGVFDYESKNIAGRQHFQAKIFECAAYADIFESTLVKYGAPTWLVAVVYQESGCNPLATSTVGARGLWQFMPESARAYGMRVVEDDVDERLNPIKSTEAAIHFLTDLKRKLGAWDLALAAYNMGPFLVTTRIAQVGGNAGFWDLAHAGLLPDETAGYVPAIEAHALILENLARLQFSSDGKRLESTAEIIVKPGTRLSLIARAAATSTLHIRELNPEFLRDVVPDGGSSARVPDAEAHRAQIFLETRSPDDDRDLCVPEDFDWGAKLFQTSKYAADCARGGPAKR
jgi:hypothetical protein